MLTKRRLQLMIRLAEFKQDNEDRAMRVVRFYKSDYIALSLIRNLFLVTLAYLILLALFAMYHMDYLLTNLNQMKVGPIAAVAVILYLMLLGIYSVIAYMAARIRYIRAYAAVRDYDQQLRLLGRIYDAEIEEVEELKQ